MINAQNNAKPMGGNIPKTFGPGNIHARITGIFLQVPGFDQHLKPYYLVYNLEGPEQGDGFEGFLVDKNNPNGARHKGQVGQVKASYWPFKDGVNPKNTSQVFKRDDSIVTALLILAKALGKEEQYNQLGAPNIEQFVELASDLLSGDKFLAWCVGGKEYDNKQGYLNYDLFLPKGDNGRYVFEQLSASPSKLQTFDESKHIVKKAPAKQVNNFGPGQGAGFTPPPVGGAPGFQQPNFNGNTPAPQGQQGHQPAQQQYGQQQHNQPQHNQQHQQQQQAQPQQPVYAGGGGQQGFGGNGQQFGGQQQQNNFGGFQLPGEDDDLPF